MKDNLKFYKILIFIQIIIIGAWCMLMIRNGITLIIKNGITL